jgi:hypothetical protein
VLRWPDACAAAGTPAQARELTEQQARKLGADPGQWFGCAENIPLADLHLQVWDDGVTDRRNGAGDDRRNGARIRWTEQASRGV